MSDQKKSTPTNIFSEQFLEQFRDRDEPNTASEAEHAGPWVVREISGGFGVFRESDAKDAQPEATFEHREHALLMAAAMPALGREPLFSVDSAEHPEGYAVQTIWGEAWNRIIGRLRQFEPEIAEALHVAQYLTRTPAALALVLEAAGATALELAGQILAQRVALDEK
jgi:hypothetical protein